jgi:hypothetical protein
MIPWKIEKSICRAGWSFLRLCTCSYCIPETQRRRVRHFANFNIAIVRSVIAISFPGEIPICASRLRSCRVTACTLHRASLDEDLGKPIAGDTRSQKTRRGIIPACTHTPPELYITSITGTINPRLHPPTSCYISRRPTRAIHPRRISFHFYFDEQAYGLAHFRLP